MRGLELVVREIFMRFGQKSHENLRNAQFEAPSRQFSLIFADIFLEIAGPCAAECLGQAALGGRMFGGGARPPGL